MFGTCQAVIVFPRGRCLFEFHMGCRALSSTPIFYPKRASRLRFPTCFRILSTVKWTRLHAIGERKSNPIRNPSSLAVRQRGPSSANESTWTKNPCNDLRCFFSVDESYKIEELPDVIEKSELGKLLTMRCRKRTSMMNVCFIY